jgi:hypothetical protein
LHLGGGPVSCPPAQEASENGVLFLLRLVAAPTSPRPPAPGASHGRVPDAVRGQEGEPGACAEVRRDDDAVLRRGLLVRRAAAVAQGGASQVAQRRLRVGRLRLQRRRVRRQRRRARRRRLTCLTESPSPLLFLPSCSDLIQFTQALLLSGGKMGGEFGVRICVVLIARQ